ncbi:SDR family oxidoreductase [Calditrichota bacterium]
MSPERQANILDQRDISVGQKHEFIADITSESVLDFARLSGDYNPLHCEPDYAKSIGYKGPVVHGVFQQALVSQAVGMWLIGKKCLITRLNTKFQKPLIYPAEVTVCSEVKRWSGENAVGQVQSTIQDKHKSVIYSESLVDVAFHSAEAVKVSVSESTQREVISEKSDESRKIVVITGASGGIFQEIIPLLSQNYDLLVVGRRREALDTLKQDVYSGCDFEILTLDLFENLENLEDIISEKTGSRPIWGIIHAASISPGRTSLIDWNLESFRREMEMTGYVSLSLGRLLEKNVNEQGGRLVLIGSNYALHNSPEKQLLRYGVGKSLMTVIAKSMAQELAGSKITVNTISPDFLAYGMNAETPPRMIKMKAAANPTKSLCEPKDLQSVVSFLLTEGSRFVSGQEIVLNGGSL